MITAENLDLDINNSFVGVTSTGGKMNYHFEKGDTVILQKGEIRIRVHTTMGQQGDSIIGTVEFVEPEQALLPSDVDTGTQISFSVNNIFGVSKK